MTARTGLSVYSNAREIAQTFDEWVATLTDSERECIEVAIKNAEGHLDKVGAFSARTLIVSTLLFLNDRRVRQ